MNRNLTKNIGLPQEDTLISNNNIKYDAQSKLWKCMLCTKLSTKYNRRQMINHVNTKHNISRTVIKTTKKKGTHVEKHDDKILKWKWAMGKLQSDMAP